MRMLLVIIGLLTSNIGYTQIEGTPDEHDWKLQLSKDGIKVFTSVVSGSKFKAVRAEILIKTSLDSLVGLVSDAEACPKWADMCKEEKIIEQISPTESYVYTYNDTPFPIKDRDILAHVVWNYSPQEKKVFMVRTATKGRLEKTKAVRIENAVSTWQFTEQEEGLVLVERYAHIDPNGPIPAWITNGLLIDSPFKTLKAMNKVIKSGKYNDYKPDFFEKM